MGNWNLYRDKHSSPWRMFGPGHRGTRWVTFDLMGEWYWDDIPNIPGCYVVIIDGEAVYVGQSMRVRDRICSHGINVARYSASIVVPWLEHNSRNVKLKIKYARNFGDWAMTELRLLKRLQPKFNCSGTNNPRAPWGSKKYKA